MGGCLLILFPSVPVFHLQSTFIFLRHREIGSSSQPSKIWEPDLVCLNLTGILYFPMTDRIYLYLMLCHSVRILLLPSFFKEGRPGSVAKITYSVGSQHYLFC